MEVFKKKCSKCGKEIKSLYKPQLEFNYKTHVERCKGNNNNKKEDDKNG